MKKLVDKAPIHLVDEAAVDLDLTDDVVEDGEEFQPLTYAELSKGNLLMDSNIDSADFDLEETMFYDGARLEEIDMDLAGLEDYAQAQDESTRKGIQDIGGKPAWGTKTSPIKGDVDPLEIGKMGLDRDAGAEDSYALLRAIGIEEGISEERKSIYRPTVSGTDDVKPHQTKSCKKSHLELSLDAEASEDYSMLPKSSATLSANPTSAPFSLDGKDKAGERYGVDADGNRFPSRFQWWERASSRHALSREIAKKITVMRRSPRMRKLQSKDYWYKPLKEYTDQ